MSEVGTAEPSYFAFPLLDRPESPDPLAQLHTSLSTMLSSQASTSQLLSEPTPPSSLAQSLSPRSAALMAAALAVAGKDEVLDTVAQAHKSKALPPLTHIIRHRLQGPPSTDSGLPPQPL